MIKGTGTNWARKDVNEWFDAFDRLGAEDRFKDISTEDLENEVERRYEQRKVVLKSWSSLNSKLKDFIKNKKYKRNSDGSD